MVIGKRSRKLREAKGLSQGEIEQRTGLLRGYISKVENGHVVPSLETLERIASALEIPLYQLFYDDNLPPSQQKAWRSVERLKSDHEGDGEKRFKRIRQLLAKNSRGSEDAKLAFSTLAKLFAKL